MLLSQPRSPLKKPNLITCTKSRRRRSLRETTPVSVLLSRPQQTAPRLWLCRSMWTLVSWYWLQYHLQDQPVSLFWWRQGRRGYLYWVLPLRLWVERHHLGLPCRSTAGSCSRWARWFSWRHLSAVSVPHRWLEEATEKDMNACHIYVIGFIIRFIREKHENHGSENNHAIKIYMRWLGLVQDTKMFSAQ